MLCVKVAASSCQGSLRYQDNYPTILVGSRSHLNRLDNTLHIGDLHVIENENK